MLEENEASMALIPGYLTRDANRAELASLGVLAYEPLWIFYNPAAFDGQPLTLLSQLEGKRVSIGPPDGKTHPLAAELLADSGVTAETTTFLELPPQAASDQLLKGEVDVLMLLEPYQADVVQELLQAPGVELANLARIGA